MSLFFSANMYLERTANLPDIDSFTFRAFIKTPEAWGNLYYPIAEFGAGLNEFFIVSILPAGSSPFRVGIYNDEPYAETASIDCISMEPNTWHVIFVTRSSGFAQAHGAPLDNTPLVSTPALSTPDTNFSRISFTNDPYGISGNFFFGSMVGACIWDGVLSLEEMENERHQISPRKRPRMYWPMISVETMTQDLSGNNFDLTSFGTFTRTEDPPLPWGDDAGFHGMGF